MDSSIPTRISRRGFLESSSAGAIALGAVAVLGSGTDIGAQAASEAPRQDPADERKGEEMKDRARITLVQLTAGDGPQSVIERMPPFFEKASEFGSDLIVFPEYVLGNRITVEDPNVQRFFELAREHHIYSIAGMVESWGEKWSTTALVVDRSGNLLGRYLKSHPASGPAPHYWPPVEGNDAEARGILGSQFKVFHLDFGPIGILQCYDGYFPEAWGCTSYSGAEVILWINGREGMIEDSHCIFAASAYGCAVGANITEGFNTGFAGPGGSGYIVAEGEREQMRLFPRIKERGDGCVHAEINLAGLRRHRKHLRTMHQRRPEMYGLLTQDVKMWQDYPDIPWDYPECADLVNKAQL
jgi:predicted amidohydrolase